MIQLTHIQKSQSWLHQDGSAILSNDVCINILTSAPFGRNDYEKLKCSDQNDLIVK
jgi:hypothetical protein